MRMERRLMLRTPRNISDSQQNSFAIQLVQRNPSAQKLQDPKCIWKDVFETFSLNHKELSFWRL